MDIFKGIRPIDYALAGALVALAVFIGFENVNAGPAVDDPHTIDSHSVLMLPVFALAALPVLWRRRAVLAAIGVAFVVLSASLPAFGWVARCGFALPLAFALAYAVARFAGSRQNQVIGLLGILALQVVALVKDAATGGAGALALSVPVTLLCYGIGVFVQSRSRARVADPTLSVEHVHA